MEIDVALEVDGSGDEYAGRDDYAAPTSLVAGLHRSSDRIRCRFFTPGDRPELTDIEILISEPRRFNAGQDLLFFLIRRRLVSLPAGAQRSGEQGSGFQNLTSGHFSLEF